MNTTQNNNFSDFFEQFYDIVLQTDDLVLLLVVSSHDINIHSVMQSHLLEKLDSLGETLRLFCLHFDENNIPFPRPLTNVIYYFAPKDTTPLFYKQDLNAVTNLQQDISLARSMIQDNTPLEHLGRSEEEIQLITNTDMLLEEENKQKMPPMHKMIRNFGVEMYKNAKQLGKGLPVLATAEESNRRFDICKSCEHLTEDARCTQCGCFMKTKVNLQPSTCPIDKW